jgi:TnpA family transposase
MGRNNQIILDLYNQSRVFGKNNQENNQENNHENNQADCFYQTGPYN